MGHKINLRNYFLHKLFYTPLGNELLKTHETIKAVVKEINPDMSEKEIRNEITNMESEIKTVSDD